VLSTAKKDMIMALVECARKIINGGSGANPAQLRELQRHSANVSRLLDRRSSLPEKRRVLQKGGFLGALLAPLLGTLGKLLL
jgi:hypothetical protein